MGDLTAFKNQIVIYGIIVALIVEVGSLFFLGFDQGFAYGLALGTAISVVNFNIMAFTMKRMLAISGGKLFAFSSYMIRMCIYGFAFYMAMRISFVSGIGSVIGFMTLKVAIYYLHAIKAKFSKGRKVRPEVAAAYARMDRMKERHETKRLRDKLRRLLNEPSDLWLEEDEEDEDTLLDAVAAGGVAVQRVPDMIKKNGGKTYKTYGKAKAVHRVR